MRFWKSAPRKKFCGVQMDIGFPNTYLLAIIQVREALEVVSQSPSELVPKFN